MEFYYTVTSQEGAIQSKPELSLGGFCSSSKVPNDTLDNLFSEVSAYSLQNPKKEYIGIILKNTLKPISSLSFWTDALGNNLCKFRLSIVELTDGGQMEMVPSVNSKPLYAEFYEATEQDPIELAFEEPFEVGAMLGVWVERSIDVQSDEYAKRNNCDFLYQMFVKKETWPTQEGVDLKVEFQYSE